MRKWVGILLVFMMAGCRTGEVKKTNVKPVVTVSILPQEFMVQQIAGDKFDIVVLVPDGSGPETYEPTPRQMQEISTSGAAFITGLLDFEKSWIPKVAEVNPGLRIVNLSEGLDIMGGEEHDHHGHEGEHHHHHSGTDPHIWLSVRMVKEQLPLILRTLIGLDSANRPFYTANYEKYVQYLDSVDREITQMVAAAGKTVNFMIYHPALGYFARDYNLEQIPVELGGKEPSAMYLKEMMDVVHEKDIKTIYYSQQFEQKSAETIAGQTGTQLKVFNPLEPDIALNLLKFAKEITGNSTK